METEPELVPLPPPEGEPSCVDHFGSFSYKSFRIPVLSSSREGKARRSSVNTAPPLQEEFQFPLCVERHFGGSEVFNSPHQ